MKKIGKRTIWCLLVAIVFLISSSVEMAKSEVETIAHTHALSERWNKTFGGIGYDSGSSVQQTSDGGYIITGDTFSFSAFSSFVGRSADVWLIKTDSNGEEEWNKTFGKGSTEGGSSVQQTTDGGYIIIGGTNSFGAGGYDAWLIKTDADGEEEWNKTFGGTNDERGSSVQQTSDGGYIIIGTMSYVIGGFHDVLLFEINAWLIKTDADGEEEWNKTFGGKGCWIVSSVLQTSDGGYVITGHRRSYGAENHGGLWLIKTDNNGNEMWNKTFGRNSSCGYSIQQTSDGGYIIVGTTNFVSVNQSVLLIKTDEDGNMTWNKTFGRNFSCGYGVQQTHDGYIIIGETGVFGVEWADIWLIRTDAHGNEEWNKTFGGINYDVGYCVQQTSDGGYIIIGATESYGAGSRDAWLIKVGGEEKEDGAIAGFEMVFIVLGIAMALILKKKIKR